MTAVRPEVGMLDLPLWEAAACRGTDPDLWFPGPNDPAAGVEARLVCAGCPVAEECRRTAGEALGIRGGLSLEQRQAGMDPADALERAKRKAGWRPCSECATLFKPDRRTAKVCSKPCRKARNAKQSRARYARDAETRETILARNREYQKTYGAAERRHRYWSDPEKARAQRRESYQRHAEEERARKRAAYKADPEKFRRRSVAARQAAKGG